MQDQSEKRERNFFIIALKEEARKAIWDTGASVTPDALIESVLPELEKLAPDQDQPDEALNEEVATEIRRVLVKAAYATRPHCIRCGTCCTVGSPTLLEEDKKLFMEDVLSPSHVFTVRKGETVRSHTGDGLSAAETEMIKIREKPGTSTCIFYREGDKECSIYESRPAQCRSQECWNPDAFEEIADKPRLTRADLLAAAGDLWKIVLRHEERCSYDELGRAVARLAATKGGTVADVIELLSYDRHVRDFVGEHLSMDETACEFFFGRPLSHTIVAFGLKVERGPDGGFLLTRVEEGEGESPVR